MVDADNDDEYLLLNDFVTYNAYHYWELYGFSADKSTSYTNTLNSISQSTETGTFSFSGNFSGSFDAAVSITGTGTIKTGSQGNTFWSSTSESGLIYDESFNGIEMTITPNANGASNDYNATYACVYNAQSTAANAVMTCTPDAATSAQPLTLPNQTITIDKVQFNTAGSIQTDLFLSLLHEDTEVGTLNGTLGMSGGGTGSLTLTENGTISTTSVNTNSLQYTMPLMGATSIDNSWQPSDINNIKAGKSFSNNPDNPYTVVTLSTRKLDWGAIWNVMQVYGIGNDDKDTKYSGNDSRISYIRTERNQGLKLTAWSVYSNRADYKNKQFRIVWDLHIEQYQNLKIIPLFVGYKNQMPDDLYRYVYQSDRTIEAIDAQTAADQQHHDEMMDTSDSAQISTDGDALINDADEKFGDLFFPLQHAIDTADDLANVQATGVIRLPAIFKDDYWYLDLTVFERKLPQAWAFIQSLCQLAVAVYMIKGLYNLFFGGGTEDDS